MELTGLATIVEEKSVSIGSEHLKMLGITEIIRSVNGGNGCGGNGNGNSKSGGSPHEFYTLTIPDSPVYRRDGDAIAGIYWRIDKKRLVVADIHQGLRVIDNGKERAITKPEIVMWSDYANKLRQYGIPILPGGLPWAMWEMRHLHDKNKASHFGTQEEGELYRGIGTCPVKSR